MKLFINIIYTTAAAVGILAVITPMTNAQGGMRGSSDSWITTKSFGGGHHDGNHGGNGGNNGGGGYHNGGSGPTFVNITCTDLTGNTTDSCELPHRSDLGVFVCRTRFNTWTGVATSSAVCIAPDRAVETDVCGCCSAACPVPCNQCPCQTDNGDTGVEVLIPDNTGGSVVLCVPSLVSANMVSKSQGAITCNTVCTSG